MNKKLYASLTAIGGYVPDIRRTNDDLAKITDTSNEWILKRTGIKERRILEDSRASSDMAVEAILDLVLNYKKNINQIDAIIVATSTPDMPMPSTASIIAQKLNLKGVFTLDINAACSGFLYALDMGASLIETKRYKNLIVVGTDKISPYINIKDRATNILFGDGAGAVWLEPSFNIGLMDSILKSSGSGNEHLTILKGGSLHPINSDSLYTDERYLHQEGKIIFKAAINSMSKECLAILERNKLTTEDVNWIVPHQANKRIIEGVAEKLGVNSKKALINIEKYGNTISASIPLCLWSYRNVFKDGDLILFTAFGAGFSWGASLVRWSI